MFSGFILKSRTRAGLLFREPPHAFSANRWFIIIFRAIRPRHGQRIDVTIKRLVVRNYAGRPMMCTVNRRARRIPPRTVLLSSCAFRGGEFNFDESETVPIVNNPTIRFNTVYNALRKIHFSRNRIRIIIIRECMRANNNNNRHRVPSYWSNKTRCALRKLKNVDTCVILLFLISQTQIILFSMATVEIS